MNQKNGKNSLGIDIIFEDLDNPIELFKKWFSKAEESEINDPNAVAVATSNKSNQPKKQQKEIGLLLCQKSNKHRHNCIKIQLIRQAPSNG